MTESFAKQGFFAAPFAVDGNLLGVGYWDVANLSPRWLAFCQTFLTENGPSFSKAFPSPFERVHLRFTSTHGAALATFSVSSNIVTSAMCMRGEVPPAEQELLEMFVESVRRQKLVRQMQNSAEPFAAASGITERPLHMVVTWGNVQVAQEDEEVVAELGNHLAAAFLCDNQ